MFPLGVLGFLGGEIFELHEVQFLYATGIMLLISLAVFVAITLATPAPDRDELSDVLFDRHTWREETAQLRDTPWYANYRYLALGLFALTVAVVVPFI